jgi:hypothetical protein
VIPECTLSIGQRFAAILDLIRAGQRSTRTLAAALSVSEPTISRCLAALRLSDRATSEGTNVVLRVGTRPACRYGSSQIGACLTHAVRPTGEAIAACPHERAFGFHGHGRATQGAASELCR